MGKDEDKSAEQPADEKTDSEKETTPEEPKEEVKEEPKQEEKKEPVAEEKDVNEKKQKDSESLRKVIKVNSEEDDKKEEKPPADESEEETGEASSRENLEQKRAILQSIKDFDFQIKKNQEEITNVTSKLDNITKDLDDLVSLYEIVSEQMNPFVGLSKVTKKRLDALENFTREIELLKERTGELESFAERSGAKLRSMSEIQEHAKTIDTDELLDGDEDEDIEKIEENKTGELEKEVVDNEGNETDITEIKPDTTNEEIDKNPESGEEPTVEEIPTSESEISFEKDIPDETFTIESQQIKTTQIPIEDNGFEGLSDEDFDIILERAFGAITPEGKIDMIINEFIESLKV